MAAPFQNYSGGVLLADIVKRNNLSTYVSEAIKESSQFIKSGAVVRNALLDAREGGTRIQVPEFNPVAPTEEIFDGTATWGTSGAGYLTPQKVGTGTQIASIVHLFEQLTGLFHTALNGHRLEKQLGGSGSTAEANYLTGSTVAEARSLLGERGEEMDLLIVHPSVAYYLYQVGLLTFSTSALAASGAVTWGGGGVGIGAREVGEFAGCRVIVDSQVNTNDPTSTGNRQEFRCYMMKSGTILEGVQQDLRIEADRNVLSKQDVLSVDYHSAYHVMGTKWGSASDNPTNANLRTGSNWSATYDIDLVPMVEIFVNSPLDNGLKS
jgi:hypothetical protein